MTNLVGRIVCVVISVLLIGCAGGTAGSGGVEVRGKVTSEQDLPIEGALIEVLSLENEPIAATSSDASGEFVFKDIPERTGEIRITLPSRAEPVVSSFSVPEGRNTAVVRVRDDSREGPTARVEYPEEDELPEDDNSEERPSPDDDDDDESDDDPEIDDDEVEERPEEDEEENDDGPVMEDEEDEGEDVDDDEGSEEPARDDEAEREDDPSAPAEGEDD